MLAFCTNIDEVSYAEQTIGNVMIGIENIFPVGINGAESSIGVF